MKVLDEIRLRRDELRTLAEEHKATALWVFGSCARGEERPDSDVDFLVRFSPESSGFAGVRLRRALASRLGRRVDVVSASCLDRPAPDWFTVMAKRDMVAVCGRVS